jgi:hypothetical protein
MKHKSKTVSDIEKFLNSVDFKELKNIKYSSPFPLLDIITENGIPAGEICLFYPTPSNGFSLYHKYLLYLQQTKE